jgi:NRAMP (natural resistance-associated macrophage protein)-like metal ion transporter
MNTVCREVPAPAHVEGARLIPAMAARQEPEAEQRIETADMVIHKPKTKPAHRVAGTAQPRLWRKLGPGLITGAADDDPSGIATYSQAGTQFGFQLGWTLLLTYPLMVVIQTISAQIGRTTGRGIAGNLRLHYPSWIVHAAIILLLVANTLNIGADLGAMAEATQLLCRGPRWLYVACFGILCICGQMFFEHTRYIAVLKWLTFSLLAYFATVLVVHVDLMQMLQGLLLPTISTDKEFWLMVVAILGTTISPYMFFWQAAQEVEDTKAEPLREPLLKQPRQKADALARIRLDTLVGMGVSNLVALAIMVTCAATLHGHGGRSVETAARAAESLRPIAGSGAFALFALGIIGTGLLSVPVLAGSAAYALGEARRWPVGLARRPLQAKAFYSTIVLATLLGAAANISAVAPMRALVWAAVINGIVSVPVMVLLMLMSTREDIMGALTVKRMWVVLGWVATAVMFVAALTMITASLA